MTSAPARVALGSVISDFLGGKTSTYTPLTSSSNRRRKRRGAPPRVGPRWMQTIRLPKRPGRPDLEAGDHGSRNRGPRIDLEYYQSDECLLVNGEYLVRSLPARILWKILHEYRVGACVEFTNRRVRLDKSLNLPDLG